MKKTENASLLIVEDDSTLNRGLTDSFRSRGYTVSTAFDGEEGLDKALDLKPDIIILDIMMPKMNGYELCRTLREEGLTMPIIMLTAKGQEEDLLLGLNLGADDYMTKPFSIRELSARVKAHLRRQVQQSPEEKLVFGNFEFDPVSQRLSRNGEHLELTPKEMQVLEFFLRNIDRALTRRQILNAAWGYSVFVTDRSVDRCIATLRQKIEEDPRRPKFLKTVREIGYRFECEET